MAKRTTVQLEDDLDGSDATETVTFCLDGNAYEIDLSARNAQKLRKALAAYVSAGRRVGAQRSSGIPSRRTAFSEDTAAIRQWARDNGYEVSDRGRISAHLRATYESVSSAAPGDSSGG